MKKIISILVVTIIIFTSVSQGLFAFAENTTNNNSVEAFAEDLTEMIRKNNSANADSFLENLLGNANSILSGFVPNMLLYENMSEDAFQTCRLIVKSKSKINHMGAVDFVNGYNDLYILQYSNELSAKMAYEYYLKCDEVEYVEPDVIYQSSIEDVPGVDIPDDEANEFDDVTAAAIEWLKDKIGFSAIKDKLAERIEDDFVLVGVIDSGVDTDHTLLADRLVESDVNLSTSGAEDSAEDDYGHGTHVSGIIVNNTLENVKIKPYKVLNSSGNGSLSTIAMAVNMAVEDGVDIINMSLTGNGESPTMTEAVNNAVANDINVVVAAGNKHLDLEKNYVSPACIESAITVSATDKYDNLADFSNYNGTIDIAAPGEKIESSYLNNTYISLSGTSMSAPQVTAGIALIRTIHLDEPAESCEKIIKDFAIKLYEKENENCFGAGLLFLKYLLDGKPTVSDPVFSVDSCSFTETFTLRLSCLDADAEIYYIVYDTDLANVNWLDGLKYLTPITISVDTKIAAIAIAKGKKPSSIITVEYDRVGETIDDFYEINLLGYITGYYGNETDIVVPNELKGREVKGIAVGAFKDDSKIKTIKLPDSCDTINPSAFKNCSELVSISGAGITDIYSNAFENSSIESFDFPNLKSIGSNAFTGCSNLNTISIPLVESIDIYAFSQSGVTCVDAPELTHMGISAFMDCYNLVSFSADKLDNLSVSALKNCTSLNSIDVPLLTAIGANSLRNTAIKSFYGEKVETVENYAFADNTNLEKIYLPVTAKTGTYVFFNCTSLCVVGLPKLEELNASTFTNCTSLINLYLPNVTSVAKSAFKDSYIELLKFEKIETIRSLPATLQALVLPGSIKNISTATPSTDFTVYGYAGSYAEEYAIENNKKFEPIPAIYSKTSEQVDVDKTYILVYAIGYNCTYQWYKNDIVSNEGGTPIEGAVHFFYEPSPEEECAAYYCVVTSNDGVYTSTVTTKPILNAPEYRNADYSEYNRILDDIASLDRTLYDKEYLDILDDLLETDVSNLKLSEQEKIDSLVIQLINTLELVKNSFIMGDINDDNEVSAIDVRFVLKYIAGIQEFNNQQMTSADMDGDGVITAIDAKLVMQKAIEL